MSAVQAIDKFRDLLPDVEVLLLITHQDNDNVFDALHNGASGYLDKNIEPADLLKSIKEVTAGRAPMSMKITRMVTQSFRQSPPATPLTERQKEVLKKTLRRQKLQPDRKRTFHRQTYCAISYQRTLQSVASVQQSTGYRQSEG